VQRRNDGQTSKDSPEEPKKRLLDQMAKLGMAREIWLFAKATGKWWIVPLLAVMLIISAILVFAEGSALAPFIYSIF
jgi:hypothetical protein